jgi:hypothetical protein
MTLKTTKTEASDAPLVVPNRRHSAGSRAILNHLAKIAPMSATRAELAAVFYKADDSQDTSSKPSNRSYMALVTMEKNSYVIRLGVREDRKFTLGPAAKLIAAHQPKPEPASAVAPAPASRPHTMQKPKYEPKPWNVPRAGAQDFKAAPSVGSRC